MSKINIWLASFINQHGRSLMLEYKLTISSGLHFYFMIIKKEFTTFGGLEDKKPGFLYC
ncbi:MAG TPA: hypothetical protein VNV85_13175 [Puia sp.]|jgi:hypothetical protein|nr:hypothetical protein [Puia sp.]